VRHHAWSRDAHRERDVRHGVHNRVASVRTLMSLRKFNGADRFRRQCRWSSVRPELLRLEKRGTHTTANKQFALAA
jgi:hypothetical protein